MTRVLLFVSLVIALALAQKVPLFPLQAATEYRTTTGTGNNVGTPSLGAIGASYRRFGGTFYADGQSEPRCGGLTTSFTCPNERDIGLTFFNCTSAAGCEDPVAGSDWAWAAGLYLAIETTRTVGVGAEVFNITVPANDPHAPALAFTRQQHGVALPRIQTNAVSSFIDAHAIYGVNDAFAAALRLGNSGLLAMQASPDGLEMPIFVGNFTGVTWANLAGNVASANLFRFGDARGNQNPVLMTVEILWMREHNRIARAILANDNTLDPVANDTFIFQEARRRVIALMQHFYTTEYAENLLGPNPLPTYSGYNATEDPTIDQFFASVALRYGHIQVSTDTLRVKDDGTTLTAMTLKDNFFDPTIITQDGVDVMLKGLNLKKHNTGEVTMINDLRNHLYAKKGSIGGDLASLNMRRGREVGLPNYNDARAAYGLPTSTNIAAFIPQDVADILIQIYGSNNSSLCDPWLCGIVEEPVNGGELGELFFTAISRQLDRLRTGDRFWYENGQFSSAELAEIKKTKFVDIILRNSNISSLACDIFEVNGVSKCNRNGPIITTTGVITTGAAERVFVSLAVILAAIFALLF